jgi:hypothetical protein
MSDPGWYPYDYDCAYPLSNILLHQTTFNKQHTTNNKPLQHAPLTLFNLPYAWLGWL